MREQFYNETTRKLLTVFGSLFTGIQISRKDGNNVVQQTLPVPIAYGPKHSFIVRGKQDPNLDREIAIAFPRMAFQLTTVSYDPQRKLQSTQKVSVPVATDTNKMHTQFSPMPYNFTVLLFVGAKNFDDSLQIVEQIIPYFRPEWTLDVNMIPEMGLTRDIPIILNDVSMEDVYENDLAERRIILWTLSFTIKGYLFGPVKTSGIIKRAITNLYPNTSLLTEKTQTISITPGLLADGSPTTNAAASIPYQTISSNSNYGFVITNEEFI